MQHGPTRLPPKKDVATALLESQGMFIHLDPRREGVSVPKWLAGQPQLVLQVGLNMPVPIPDLVVDETGISCTLSFNRAPFWCSMPWSAVYALIGEDGRGMVWPEDVPSELSAHAPDKVRTKAKRAALRRVETEEPEAETPDNIRRIPSAPPASTPPGGMAAGAELEPEGTQDSEAPPPPPSRPPNPVLTVARKKKPLPPYLRVIK